MCWAWLDVRGDGMVGGGLDFWLRVEMYSGGGGGVIDSDGHDHDRSDYGIMLDHDLTEGTV